MDVPARLSRLGNNTRSDVRGLAAEGAACPSPGGQATWAAVPEPNATSIPPSFDTDGNPQYCPSATPPFNRTVTLMQSSTRGESALLSRGQSAVLEIGDGFSFCRGFPGVIRVVDYPPPAAAAVVEVAATSGAATSDNTGGIERRRAHGGGGQGCGGDQHHGTTDRGAGSDAIRDDGLDHVMDDTTRASAAATSAAVCTDFPDNGDTDDGSDVRCKGQDESISRKTHEVSSDSCEISNTLDSERAENSQENTEAFEMPVPHIISQDPDALGCGEIDPENINRSPHSGGGCGVDKDGQDRRVHSESPLRGSNNDRCGSVSPSGGGRDRGDDGISMMEQPPTSKAATHNVKPRASARQPGSPPPPLQAAATSTASIETLEGLRVALIKLGLSKQRRKLFQERAAQFGAEALDWPMAPSSTQVAANNKDNGTDPKPPPGLLSPATAHGAASLLGPLARSRRMMGGKGKGKKRAREGSSWQTSGVRGTPTVPPTPTRRRRDQLTPISPPPQNLDHSEYSAKRSEKSVPGTSTKRSCESPREGLATRSMTTDSDDLMTTNTTSTIASGDTGCTTFAGSDVAAAAVSTGGRTGRDGSGIESSGYWGGGSSVVAELVRHGFTHAICAANAPRRLLWAELGLLPESPAAAPVRKGGGDSGGTLGDGMTAGAAVEIVSEEWLVNCLQEQVSEQTFPKCIGADAVSLLLW